MAFKKGDKINLGRKRTLEEKEKNRIAHLGKIPWNKGLTKETDKRVLGYSNTKKGKSITEEHRKNLSISHKGKIPAIKGKHFNQSEEAKQKLRENAKINPNYGMRGKHHTEESKNKTRGEKSYNWLGGISFEPYTIDWTETLKRSIRERDHYTCKLCKEQQDNRVHAVHHIDYNKFNCNPNNLITLCVRCHAKTNSNREKWKEFFGNLMKV